MQDGGAAGLANEMNRFHGGVVRIMDVEPVRSEVLDPRVRTEAAGDPALGRTGRDSDAVVLAYEEGEGRGDSGDGRAPRR